MVSTQVVQAGIALIVLSLHQRGRYLDCEEDLGDLIKQKDIILKNDLYKLSVDFIGGRPNDGGMYLRERQAAFKSKFDSA